MLTQTPRTLDIHRVLESRLKIVGDHKGFLKASLHSVFSGTSLIDWLLENYNPTNTNRDGLVKLVREDLSNPAAAYQFIYPIDTGEEFQDSPRCFYRFIEDQFREYKKDASLLNLYGIDTSIYKFFYEDQGGESILNVLDDLKGIVEEMFSNFSNQSKTLIDYCKMGESEIFNTKYLETVSRLAFADLSPILSDADQIKAFFLNIYNLMNIHGIISHNKAKKDVKLLVIDRVTFYPGCKYNIGGQNFTLSDIEQGVLRRNSTIATNATSTIFDFALGSKSKGDRFKQFDPRRKFVLQYLDPRIHFALNPGTISSPALRYYNIGEVNFQLEIAAHDYCEKNFGLTEEKGKTFIEMNEMFSFYKSDFAKDNKALINYVLSYKEDTDAKAHIQSVFDKNEFILRFSKFDWTVNKLDAN